MYYPIRMPGFMPRLFPALTWCMPSARQEVYLTFDDGPIAGVTDKILDWLQQADAKATFFVVGNNATRNPELLQRAVVAGHTIGNHTYNHVSGWRVSQEDYRQEIDRTEAIIESQLTNTPNRLKWFRPPYGQLPPRYGFVADTHRIAMWDVLAADWDPQYTPNDCLNNVINNWRPGSLIVLHDSQKCAERCLYVVPRLLEHFSKIGVMVKALPA